MNESSIQFVAWQNPNPSCPRRHLFSWHPGFYAPAGNAGWIPGKNCGNDGIRDEKPQVLSQGISVLIKPKFLHKGPERK